MILKSKNKKEEGAVAESKIKINFQLLSVVFIRYFDLIVFFLVVIIFIIGFLFFVKPKYNDLKEIQKVSIEKYEERKESLRNYLFKLEEYRKVYESISVESRERVEKILPDKEVNEEFFIRIDTLVSRQGLVLKELFIDEAEFQEYDEFAKKKSPDKKDSNIVKEVREVKLNLVVSGTDYKAFKRLLAALENNLRIMDINNLTFSPERKETALSITTYYQP